MKIKLPSQRQSTRPAAAKFVFWRYWLLVALMFSATSTHASERGKPVVDVIVTQDFHAAHENRAILTLPDGRIAVSNLGGLMVFDGARWRYQPHPKKLANLSMLALHPDGRLFGGFNGDLGWYEPDGKGFFSWHSLTAGIAEEDQLFSSLGRVSFDASRNGVWYVTSNRLFFYDLHKQKFRVVGTGAYAAGFNIGNDVWFINPERQLVSTVLGNASTLKPVPGGDIFSPNGVRSAWVDAHGTWLTLTNSAIYRRAPGSTEFAPFMPELWPRLAANNLSTMQVLRDGHYLLIFVNSGPMLMDAQGRILEEFSAADGVPNNRSFQAVEDRDGAIWIAQARTVTRLDLAHGVSYFDASNGLPAAHQILRWQHSLFAQDSAGLYQLRPGLGAMPAQFTRVLPQISQITSMAVLDDARLLLCGSDISEISGTAPSELKLTPRAAVKICNVLQRSNFVAGRVWAGTSNGLLRIDAPGTQPMLFTTIAQVQNPIFEILELDANTLWIADRAGGLWRVRLSGDTTTATVAFGIAQGLPPGGVKLFPGKVQPWFATSAGLRVFDERSQKFEVPAGMPTNSVQSKIFSVLEDESGKIWLRGEDINGVLEPMPGGGYKMGMALASINRNRTIMKFYREQNVLWVGRSDDLIRIELAAQKDLPPPLAPQISAIEDLQSQQDIMFDQLTQLPSSTRSLRFAFALASAHRSEANTYRSKLSGVDQQWSDWSARNERDYSYLSDGAHRFEIEAQDSFGRISAMLPLSIVIARPWYRTPLAYLSYLTSVILALWLAANIGARHRQRAFAQRQLALETTVAERTEELTLSNAKLAEQAQRLTELDKLKTNFFINVGHEFRTPLTLVLGPIDDLLRDARERFSARAREQLEMANRNARRVLDLIVELLDVNRFEHGKMQLMRLPCDIDALVRRCVADSAELMQRFGHQIRFERDDMHDAHAESAWFAAIDAVQIERCISNLIGNAGKYMTRGGLIEVRLARTEAHLLISVSDHGRGIAPEAVPHIFDRFFQTESSDRASGYGIGLALVHQIIEAHQGRIGVESILGLGSRFQIELSALSTTQNQRVAASTSACNNSLQDYVEHIHEPNANAQEELDDQGEQSAPRARVLVVDDHDDLRARVRALLEQAPYTSDAQHQATRARFEVLEANDGPSAWLACCEALPDLIVCDVMMPGFDGVELSRRLRANPDTATIPLLLLTAKVGSEHAVAGLNAGADDYLAKPFDASELLARVDALLARGHRLRLRMEREAQVVSASLPTPSNAADYTPIAETSAAESRADQRWRERLEAQIAAHLSDAEWSIEALSTAMHVDRTHLFRKCKELLGASPSDYLRDTRLSRACELLSADAGNISEIAYAVGFVSLSSFTRAFKARYSMAPSQMQKTRLSKAS